VFQLNKTPSLLLSDCKPVGAVQFAKIPDVVRRMKKRVVAKKRVMIFLF